MKSVYKHGDSAYIILRALPINRFFMKETEQPDMELVKEYRDWCGADHVLRDNTHFMFCETIEDVEWEDLE